MLIKSILHSLFASLMVQLSFAYSKEYNDNTVNNIEKDSVLNIGNGEDPTTLDPQKCNENTCSSVVRQLFEGLIKTDKNDVIIPASAKKWKISADHKVYTFYFPNYWLKTFAFRRTTATESYSNTLPC